MHAELLLRSALRRGRGRRRQRARPLLVAALPEGQLAAQVAADLGPPRRPSAPAPAPARVVRPQRSGPPRSGVSPAVALVPAAAVVAPMVGDVRATALVGVGALPARAGVPRGCPSRGCPSRTPPVLGDRSSAPPLVPLRRLRTSQKDRVRWSAVRLSPLRLSSHDLSAA